MGRHKKRRLPKLKLRQETFYSLLALFFIASGILLILSFTGQGKFLQAINAYLSVKIGLGLLFLPFVFLASGMVMLQSKWAWSKPHVLLGTLFLMLGTMGVSESGTIGAALFLNLAKLINPAGAYVFFTFTIIGGALIVSQFSLVELLEGLAKIFGRQPAVKLDQINEDLFDHQKRGGLFSKLSLNLGKKRDFKINEHKFEEGGEAKSGTAVAAEIPKLELKGGLAELSDKIATTNAAPMLWTYPPLSLLANKIGGEADRGDVNANADLIEKTLYDFGIRAKVKEVNSGPSVTQYALEITRGTKLSRITALSTDLALALAAPTGQIRIEAPIAGRSLVGVEVPNKSAAYVTLKGILSSSLMKKQKSKLSFALGINVSNQPVIVDLSWMPHILVAGATGSGKSVCINAILCSILFRASPDEVKLILVDPKRVELTGYNGVPHLLTPVIVDPQKVVSALKWATHEMEQRYKKLAEVGVKNIDAYNELAGFSVMPSIVIVIDELADIMLFSPKEVEDSITRIAQMARAVGIHLVLATQRPSVDVITGLIKANIPCRIAFNVSSMMDSRVILDQPGAEKLLGRGDMLYIPPDQAKPSRIQGTFVSERETKALIDFIKSQGKEPEYTAEITTKYQANTFYAGIPGTATADRDELFNESVKLVSQADKASSSMIQRRLSVGYARAARILDQLHEAGLVAEPDGSKPRDVHMDKIREYLGTLTKQNS